MSILPENRIDLGTENVHAHRQNTFSIFWTFPKQKERPGIAN